MSIEEKEKKQEPGLYKTKAWYRFLKVIYIFSCLMWLLTTALIFGSLTPHSVVDYADISCLNGKNFTTKEVGLDLLYDSISSSDYEKIVAICSAGDDGRVRVEIKNSNDKKTGTITAKNFNSTYYNILEQKVGFTHSYVYRLEGSWLVCIGGFIVVFTIGLIILLLVRRTLRYILTGKSFFN